MNNGKVVKNSGRIEKYSEFLSKILASFLLMFLIYSCTRPLSGFHTFRQAQTAWPVKWWIENGFDPFNPVVPIKGLSHQTWILELPLFQWLAYLLNQVTGLTPIAASRFLSLVFAMSVVAWFSKILAEISGFRQRWILLFFIMNPYFIYWSTTGLVDWLAFSCTLLGSELLLRSKNTSRVSNWLCLLIAYFFYVSACLTKPSHFIFALGAFLTLRAQQKNLEISRMFISFLPVLLPTVLSYLVWRNWSSSHYPQGDPRRIWSVTRENYSWYFGSLDQYKSVIGNLYAILERFTGGRWGVLIFLVTIIVFLSSNLNLMTKIGIPLVYFLYLLKLLNLNVVHNYYQIPILFSYGSVMILGFQKICSVFPKHKKIRRPAVLFLAVLLFVTQIVGGEREQYIEMAKDREVAGASCLGAEKSRNLVTFQAEDPSVFYNCGLASFMINIKNPDEMVVFSKEFKRYRLLYAESNNLAKSSYLLSSVSKNKLIRINGNWYRIVWLDLT